MKTLAAVLVVASLAACAPIGINEADSVVVHEVRSSFSHIRIRDSGPRRGLFFVGEGGREVLQTLIDQRHPHRLQHPYSHTMQVGLLYQPDASMCLLVGLGGGAMVRFLNHDFPEMQLDVVEIDPVVVALAREFFGTVPGPRTRIITEDAFQYLRQAPERYDVIFMDAFLMPGKQAGATDAFLRLKTATFLQSLRERLRPGGVVVFNMVEGADTAAHIEDIRSAFSVAEVFRPPLTGNVIVVGLPSGRRPSDGELRQRARVLDSRGERGFSFERLLDQRSS